MGLVMSDSYGWLRPVSSTALKISRVTASGWETMDACEAATSSIRAFPRSAMNRWPAGGMARSSVPSRYHEGMDRHPGVPEGVAAAAPLQGRWVAAIKAAVSGSTSAANVSGNSWRSRYKSTPSLPSGFVNALVAGPPAPGCRRRRQTQAAA